MAIPSSSKHIYHIAETLDNQLRIVKQYIQAVNDNTSVDHIFTAYKHCVTAQNYFASLTGVNMAKVGDAIALQFGNDSYSTYNTSYNALKDNKIPAFLTKVENNISFLTEQIGLDTTSGEQTYGSLAPAARDSIMINVTSILAEFE